MMEMDGRDSVKCQNPRLEDMEGFNRIVNEIIRQNVE